MSKRPGRGGDNGKRGSNPFVRNCKRRKRTWPRNRAGPAGPKHALSGPDRAPPFPRREPEPDCTTVYFSPSTTQCALGTRCSEDTAATHTDKHPCPGGACVRMGGATGHEQVTIYPRRTISGSAECKEAAQPWEPGAQGAETGWGKVTGSLQPSPSASFEAPSVASMGSFRRQNSPRRDGMMAPISPLQPSLPEAASPAHPHSKENGHSNLVPLAPLVKT